MHVYEQLFLGQITVTSFRRFGGRFRDGTFIVPFPVNFPPPQAQFCPAAVSYHVDHTHQVYIPRDALCRLYRTSVDLSHSHILELSDQEMQVLRQGGTIQKTTSVDARPGGSPHTHEVSVSCFGFAGYGTRAPYSGAFAPGFPGPVY